MFKIHVVTCRRICRIQRPKFATQLNLVPNIKFGLWSSEDRPILLCLILYPIFIKCLFSYKFIYFKFIAMKSNFRLMSNIILFDLLVYGLIHSVIINKGGTLNKVLNSIVMPNELPIQVEINCHTSRDQFFS